MASRRMIDKDFILSDNFTALSAQAQALYIRLIVSADDEGYVSNLSMLTGRGNALDKLKEANLLHVFSTGCALILHWNIHNTIRKDRLIPTIHTREKALVELGFDKIYRIRSVTDTAQNDSQMTPQNRVDQNRSDKNREEAACGASCEKDFNVFWESYPNKSGRNLAYSAFEKTDVPLDTLMQSLENHKKSRQWQTDGGAYIPKAANWLSRRLWEDRLPPHKAVPMGATGELGEAERAAIRRLLAEEA